MKIALKKIKDLKVGTTDTITLVVVSSSVRQTKAGKDYVNADFFDGYEHISGNMWDTNKALTPNDVLVVSAEISSYNDAKQLVVKATRKSTEFTVDDFMPKSDNDEEEVYKKVIKLVSNHVKDDFLRNLTMQLLEDSKDPLLNVPGAIKMHHAYKAGTLVHSYSVAKLAYAISKEIKGANTDLCLVGGLLHDIGKLLAYETNGVQISMTDQGLLLDHTYLGTVMLQSIGMQYLNGTIHTNEGHINFSKLELLLHIIASHHGKMEYGAIVPPSSIEAHIVSAADGIDAATTQVYEACQNKEPSEMWTDRVWALNNRQQVLPQYTYNIMKET